MQPKMTIGDLEDLFKKVSNISNFVDLQDLKAINTPNGLAISISHVVSDCVKDYQRSLKFIESVKMAIRDKGKRVLYLGCGPFALLLLESLKEFEGIQATLVEINERSLLNAKYVIETLKLDRGHQLTYLKGDACEDLGIQGEYDLIISETMGCFLSREPFVEIIRKNLKYLRSGGEIIPQEVNLKINGIGVLKFNKHTALKNPVTSDHLEVKDPRLICETEVVIYKDLILSPGESTLTYEVLQTMRSSGRFNLSYKSGRYPHLSITK